MNKYVKIPKTQQCFCCKKFKKLKMFGDDLRGKYGKKRECMACKRLSSKKYRKNKKKKNDIKYYAYIIYKNMCKKHKDMGFKYLPEFTIGEISDIIKKSKCEVSNRSFNCKNIIKYRINPFMASPDRINNKIGYRRNNVRWVMVWINIARQMYDVDFFLKLIKGVKW